MPRTLKPGTPWSRVDRLTTRHEVMDYIATIQDELDHLIMTDFQELSVVICLKDNRNALFQLSFERGKEWSSRGEITNIRAVLGAVFDRSETVITLLPLFLRVHDKVITLQPSVFSSQIVRVGTNLPCRPEEKLALAIGEALAPRLAKLELRRDHFPDSWFAQAAPPAAAAVPSAAPAPALPGFAGAKPGAPWSHISRLTTRAMVMDYVGAIQDELGHLIMCDFHELDILIRLKANHNNLLQLSFERGKEWSSCGEITNIRAGVGSPADRSNASTEYLPLFLRLDDKVITLQPSVFSSQIVRVGTNPPCRPEEKLALAIGEALTPRLAKLGLSRDYFPDSWFTRATRPSTRFTTPGTPWSSLALITTLELRRSCVERLAQLSNNFLEAFHNPITQTSWLAPRGLDGAQELFMLYSSMPSSGPTKAQLRMDGEATKRLSDVHSIPLFLGVYNTIVAMLADVRITGNVFVNNCAAAKPEPALSRAIGRTLEPLLAGLGMTRADFPDSWFEPEPTEAAPPPPPRFSTPGTPWSDLALLKTEDQLDRCLAEINNIIGARCKFESAACLSKFTCRNKQHDVISVSFKRAASWATTREIEDVQMTLGLGPTGQYRSVVSKLPLIFMVSGEVYAVLPSELWFHRLTGNSPLSRMEEQRRVVAFLDPRLDELGMLQTDFPERWFDRQNALAARYTTVGAPWSHIERFTKHAEIKQCMHDILARTLQPCHTYLRTGKGFFALDKANRTVFEIKYEENEHGTITKVSAHCGGMTADPRRISVVPLILAAASGDVVVLLPDEERVAFNGYCLTYPSRDWAREIERILVQDIACLRMRLPGESDSNLWRHSAASLTDCPASEQSEAAPTLTPRFFEPGTPWSNIALLKSRQDIRDCMVSVKSEEASMSCYGGAFSLRAFDRSLFSIRWFQEDDDKLSKLEGWCGTQAVSVVPLFLTLPGEHLVALLPNTSRVFYDGGDPVMPSREQILEIRALLEPRLKRLGMVHEDFPAHWFKTEPLAEPKAAAPPLPEPKAAAPPPPARFTEPGTPWSDLALLKTYLMLMSAVHRIVDKLVRANVNTLTAPDVNGGVVTCILPDFNNQELFQIHFVHGDEWATCGEIKDVYMLIGTQQHHRRVRVMPLFLPLVAGHVVTIGPCGSDVAFDGGALLRDLTFGQLARVLPILGPRLGEFGMTRDDFPDCWFKAWRPAPAAQPPTPIAQPAAQPPTPIAQPVAQPHISIAEAQALFAAATAPSLLELMTHPLYRDLCQGAAITVKDTGIAYYKHALPNDWRQAPVARDPAARPTPLVKGQRYLTVALTIRDDGYVVDGDAMIVDRTAATFAANEHDTTSFTLSKAMVGEDEPSNFLPELFEATSQFADAFKRSRAAIAKRIVRT